MRSAAALRGFLIGITIRLVTISCAEILVYPCVDLNWTKCCKIGVGNTYKGWDRAESISGQPCVGGTVCEYNREASRIQCQVSSSFAPYNEDCEIPMCSELPLCEAHLENFNGLLVNSREGVALVSTADELMAAARDHTVTEVQLLHDISISEEDFSGVPILFREGRKVDINIHGQAKITCRLTNQESLPTFFVFSGANVTIHRVVFIGNPIADSYMLWEKLGHVTILDSEFNIQPCSMISAYIRGMFTFQLEGVETTTTANEQDSALEFVVRESGVLPGGSGQAGVLLYDPEKNLGGTQRYINTTVRCTPYGPPPAPPPIAPNPLFFQPVSGTEDEDSPPMKARNKHNNNNVLVGGVVSALVMIGALAAFMTYRQLQTKSTLDSETDRTEIVLVESPHQDLDECSEWIRKMADRIDHKTVPSSAKLCEEIASVVASVNQMALEKCSTRIRKAQEFRTMAKSANVHIVSGHSSSPSSPVADAEGTTVKSKAMKDVAVASFAMSSVIAELRSGRVVNGYEYVNHLGSGTQGEVLLVREINRKVCYTMKVPKDTNVQLVVQEAYLLAMLDHPNIIKHEETFVHHGELIVVTEYCSSGDLQQCLATISVPPQEAFVRSILLQLAFAVSHMHMNMLAHRDIKPSNIFISESGIVKLGDLGSGRVIVDKSETFAGTPMFMAPQIIAGEAYTKECDIYSLGSVIYYLCCGKVAHSDAKSMDELKDLQARGPDLSRIRNGYSGQLTNAIARMMSPSEALRPPALEVLNWDWLRLDEDGLENKELDALGVVKSCVRSARK